MASKADVEAGKAFVRLYLKNDFGRQLAGALNAAGAKMQSWGRSTMVAGATITAAGAAILAPIAAAVKSFAAQGDELDKMSKRTGIAGGALAELSFAAEQSGSNLGEVEVGIKRMQRTLTDASLGLSTAVDGLAMVGLRAEQLEGLNPEEQFQRIAAGLAEIDDPSKRAAAALMLFGRSGTQLLPMLNDLSALRQEARDLGIIPSQEDIDNAAKVTDAVNRVRRAVKAMFFNIGAGVAGPALKFLEILKRIAVSVGQFAKNKGPVLIAAAAIGAALVVAGTALTTFGIALWSAGFALSALGSVVGVLLSPIGLITGALIGGAAAWLKFSESGKKMWASLGPIIETLKTAFSGVMDAMLAGDWELAGKIAMTGLKLAFLQGLAAIQEAFPKTFQTVLRGFGRIADGIVFVWGKMTGFLREQWNSWGKHTLQIVVDVASKFAEVWQSTVEGLANWMLKASAQGGVMGKLMSKILGVDMAEVQKERDRLNKALGLGHEDVLGETRKAVKQYVESLGLPGVEAGTGNISQWLEDFLDKLESGMAVDDVAKELEALRKEAAKQREEATKGGAGPSPNTGLGGAITAVPRGVALTATYSAAAAQIAGYQPGGGPQEKMAVGIAAIERNTAEMTRQQQEFLAGWRVA